MNGAGMDTGQWAAIAVVGYASQWLRGMRGLQNAHISIVITLVAMGLWWLWVPHEQSSWQQQLSEAVSWALGPHGVARAAQELKIAPVTNSIGPVPKKP